MILDAERCILCSRCTRFCDEITGTGELGIFHRGDHSEVGLFPGRQLDNGYSGNVVDICPVGALTDRDFRFQVRVWYLDAARSVCPGCARGCNIEVHVNRRRPHHADGRRVARLKPRFNAGVNAWWICDEGRYGFKGVDAPSRLATPTRRQDGAAVETGWDEAIATVAAALRAAAPDEVGILASSRMANEDLMAVRRLAEARGLTRVASNVPPSTPTEGDDFLLRADRTPNTRGTQLLGLDGDAGAVLAAARDGRLTVLWVFHHDLLASGWPPADVARALERVETVIVSATNASATTETAGWVLPTAAWVERDGTFTNFEGRVQRFRPAVAPVGQALPDWEVVGRVLAALGADPGATRAEHWFRELAGTVDAFGGMTYAALGDAGQLVAGAVSAGAPVPPGRRRVTA